MQASMATLATALNGLNSTCEIKSQSDRAEMNGSVCFYLFSCFSCLTVRMFVLVVLQWADSWRVINISLDQV